MLKTFKRKIIIIVLFLSLFAGFFPILKQRLQNALAQTDNQNTNIGQLVLLQENSLAQVSSPQNPEQMIKAIITAYSSTPGETDDTPFVTAAGTAVRDGVVANNLLPFGTKIKIPNLYGDKVFVVEDRMNSKKGNNQFDVWFASHEAAEQFGVKIIYVEILKD